MGGSGKKSRSFDWGTFMMTMRKVYTTKIGGWRLTRLLL